jgi:hypothetical protein
LAGDGDDVDDDNDDEDEDEDGALVAVPAAVRADSRAAFHASILFLSSVAGFSISMVSG